MHTYCSWFTDAEIRADVRRGVKLLNKAKKGWYKKIVMSKLDIQDPSKCILGQVFGDFDEGLKAIGLNYDVTGNWSRHGFAGDYHKEPWLAEIRRLRKRNKAKKLAMA